MNKSLFKKVRATLKHLSRYIPQRLDWAVHYFFVRLLSIRNSLNNNLLNVIIKILTKQCAPCPNVSIMILQKGIAIRLEGRHLVLTLLASKKIIFYMKQELHVQTKFGKTHAKIWSIFVAYCNLKWKGLKESQNTVKTNSILISLLSTKKREK